MLKTNKIIRKHLLPVRILNGIIIAGALAVSGYTIIDKKQTKDMSLKETVEYAALVFAGMALSTCLVLLPSVEIYKNNYAFASYTAREFLKQEMEEHPELKTFEKVLTNPRAIQSVATMISNSLRDSEQKQVLAAVDEMFRSDPKNEEELIAATKQAHAKIVKIVQEHAAVHPEFAKEVLAMMAYADTTYVLPVQYRTR